MGHLDHIAARKNTWAYPCTENNFSLHGLIYTYAFHMGKSFNLVPFPSFLDHNHAQSNQVTEVSLPEVKAKATFSLPHDINNFPFSTFVKTHFQVRLQSQ